MCHRSRGDGSKPGRVTALLQALQKVQLKLTAWSPLLANTRGCCLLPAAEVSVEACCKNACVHPPSFSPSSTRRVWLTTFGSPRVGNKAFAQDFMERQRRQGEVHAYRVANIGDIVPR